MMNDSGSNSTLVDLLKPLIRGASTDSYNVKKWQKTYLDVLGVCCSSEVVLVEKLLKPLEGVQKVTVIVPSRTVIIVHDPVAVPQSHIVKTLNKAGLEASVRAYGTSKIINKWPSSYILACGFLLLMSLFKWFFHPLHWLALAAACVGLPPMLLRGFTAACRLTLDINILMLVAVGGAIALNDYLEAGTIVFLFTTAEWLETLACRKASAGMSSLMSMIPQKAVLAETGEVVDVDDVHIDTVIAIRAGEVVPIDGVVVNGQSEVDERSLTGESFPVSKQAQSQVWAGTLNIDGYITVRTTAMAENSAAAKMARLVEEAQNSRSKTQRLIDSCAKYYTPAVVVLAAGVALVPLVVRAHNLKYWFELALVLLVSACPCALVLSTPVATFCALLRAARMGLLIKGGDILESLAEIKVAAFDKTGTITKGDFSIEAFHVIGQKVEISNLLYWVSCIESKSSHPMASALVNYAQSKSIQPKPDNVAEFHIYPGEGIYGEIDRNHIYIGNKRIMTRASSQTPPEMKDLRGVSVGYVFCNKELVGVFLLSDDCRTGSKEAIMELKSLGIKSVMLTGDSTAAAAHAQNQLGGVLDELHSELLPEDKVHIIGDLRMREGPTLMVGDGMNDAPALAKADVGVSMGISGSAVAMETSHVTLMSSDILRIPKVIRLGKRTHWTILANIIFSLGAKVGVLVFALAGHPLIWAAVLADVGTCLLVILNSMLLLRERKSTREEKCRASVKSLAMRSQLTGSNTACESSKDNNYNIWIKDEGNTFHCCQEQTKKEHSVVIDMPPEPTVHTKAKNKIGGCCDNNIVVGGASQKCHACEREKSSGKEKCTSGQAACCKQQRTEFGSSHATAEDCKNVGCSCGREEHGRASVAMVNKDLRGCCKNFENEVGTKEILEDYGNTKCSASGTQEFVKENCCSGARKALMEGEIGGCCKNRNKEIAEVNLKDCRRVKSVVRVEARNLGGERMVDTLLGQKKTPTRPDLVWELM